MTDTTLQINLSPGDVAYAHLTVPALLRAHPNVSERLLVVDLCKPQATRIVDPVRRFPEPGYTQRANQIAQFADRCLAEGMVDRVVTLRPGEPILTRISQRWLRGLVRETHDYGGCALMAYLVAFEVCRTRWLLHYDADMLLYQATGFDWAAEARSAIDETPGIIAACPRPSAPIQSDLGKPSHAEGLPFETHAKGWLNGWFSTRCYLFDRLRLERCLPLLQGRLYWEMLAVRLLRRGYPRSPEVMFYWRLGAAGYRRLMLRDERAWLIHPAQKDATWSAALPKLVTLVAGGKYPERQSGHPDLVLDWWGPLLANSDGTT